MSKRTSIKTLFRGPHLHTTILRWAQGCVVAMLVVLTTGVAHASYVQQCKLSGVVVDDPKDITKSLENGIEREAITFRLLVQSAVANGREDSNCNATFLRKTIPVLLYSGIIRNRQIKKGDHLLLNYLAKNNEGMPGPTETFEVLEVPPHK